MNQPLHSLEFEFSDQHFSSISRLVTEKTGIELPPHKKNLVYARLVRRLRELKLEGFSAYIEYLKLHLQDELEPLVNAITTNVTSFYREEHHFEHLKNIALPDLQNKFGLVNLWCAAASTGEEPYTIAFTVKEAMAKQTLKCRITASDLDSQALQKAKQGIYTIDPTTLGKFPILKKYTQPHQDLLQVKPEIQAMLQFQQINLMQPNWPIKSPIHIVFCRNCVIYFSKETQRKLFSRIAEMMPSGSYLYLGHSESLLNVSDAFNSVGRTIYQKI